MWVIEEGVTVALPFIQPSSTTEHDPTEVRAQTILQGRLER